MSETKPPPPFQTYERTRIERKNIATVTAENIGQIAALIGGSVDYANGGQPVLIVPPRSDSPLQSWRVKVGWQVSLLGSMLVNANGFNLDNDWALVAPDHDTERDTEGRNDG